MKLAILIFFLFSSYGFGAKKGDLQLPDIYVWGEDKSYLSGLYDKEDMIRPRLRKFNFLTPLSLNHPAKLDFLNIYPASKFLRISGGGGLDGEYILRASGGGFVIDNLFYSYDLIGRREVIESRNFSLISGSLNFGKNYKKAHNKRLLWSGNISGLSSDFLFRRNLLKVETEFFWDPLIFTINPFFSFNNIDIDGKTGTEYAIGLKSEIPISFNHRLMADMHFRNLKIADKNHWKEINISYHNTVFRDFSFLLKAGALFHNRIDFIFSGTIGGNVLNTGYRIYVSQKYYKPDIYLLYSRYKFLKFRPQQAFRFEGRRSLALKLIRNLDKLGEANIDFRFNRIENPLILINSPAGLVPFNKERPVDIFEIKTEFERDFLRLRYIYRHADTPLPYLYNEFNFIVSPTFKLSSQKSVNIKSALNYITPHQRWLNEEGRIEEDIESYWEWNFSLRYNISRWGSVEIGGENLLAQKVRFKGGYVKDARRFYITLSIGFSG